MWPLVLAGSALAAPEDVVLDLDSGRVEAHLRELTGADPVEGGPIVSRSVYHPDLARAVDHVAAELAAIPGLEVRREAFDAGDAGVVENLVAELPGRVDGAPWVVVGAHLDSTANLDERWTSPSSDPAPGADDDASGVSVLLEVARLCAAWEPGFDHPIRFVFFNAEEVGLLGSFHHVDELTARGDDVLVMLQLDPVGYNPSGANTLWYTYDQRSVPWHEGLGTHVAGSATALQVRGIDETLIGGDARSDHYPFWLADIPALHFGSFPQPPTYHTMDDTLDNVDPAFVAEVAGLVGSYVAEVAIAREPAERRRGCDHAGTGSIAGLLGLAGLLRRSGQ